MPVQWKIANGKLISFAFLVACYATVHPAVSVGWSVFIFWPHCSCPNGLATSNMAPAHPHATSVAVYPALFLPEVSLNQRKVIFDMTNGPLTQVCSLQFNAENTHTTEKKSWREKEKKMNVKEEESKKMTVGHGQYYSTTFNYNIVQQYFAPTYLAMTSKTITKTKWSDRLTDGRTDRKIDGQKDGRTDRLTDIAKMGY